MPAIILNSTALIALLDSEISRLKNERRNDPEHEETIARLIAIRDECIAFREAVEIFAENKTNEEVVVQKANAFWKPFQDFWANDCSGIISGSAQLGIIAGGAELIKLAGAPPIVATLVAGAVVAHKPIVEVFKSVKGMLKGLTPWG